MMHVASTAKPSMHVTSTAEPATKTFKTKTRLRIEKMIAKIQQRALEDDIIAGKSVTRAQAHPEEKQYTAARRKHDEDEGLSTPSPLPTNANLPYKQRLVHRWGKG